MKIGKIVVMTDLDGTLLDEDMFTCSPIEHSIKDYLEQGLTIILNSSKTEDEIREFCKELGEPFPFICENGAAFHNSNKSVETNRLLNDYRIFGISIPKIEEIWVTKITNQLRNLCKFIDEMPKPNQTEILGLSGSALDRAMNRKYSRLFIFNGTASQFIELNREVIKCKLKITQGGRVMSLSGRHGKSQYHQIIKNQALVNHEKIIFVGIGDSKNDIEMLSVSDIACIIPPKNRLPLNKSSFKNNNFVYESKQPAPIGWIEAIDASINFIDEHF